MREYHLGEEEAKKDGELVVSKIFYQLANKSMQISETEIVMNYAPASVINPKTPKIVTPQPRHLKNSPCETKKNIYPAGSGTSLTSFAITMIVLIASIS
jgi:hypothetical protein